MAINLLPQNLKKAQERDRQQTIASALSVTFLIILISAVGILFSYRVFVTRQYNDFKDQIDDLTVQLKQFEGVEGTLKAIHLKTEKIRDIFEKHYPYGEVLEDLDARSGDQIEIVEVEVLEQDNFAVLAATDSLPTMAEYLKVLDQEIPEYQNVKVEEIEFNTDDFRYELTIKFQYVPTSAENSGGSTNDST